MASTRLIPVIASSAVGSVGAQATITRDPSTPRWSFLQPRVSLGVLQSANLWGRPVTLFACTFASGCATEARIAEFFRKLARPAGFEPATLGLEGRCREIPLLGSDRRLWDLLRRANQPGAVEKAQGSGVSENADPEEAPGVRRARAAALHLRGRPLWTLMPPTPAVGEQTSAPTRGVGRMPARRAAGDGRAGGRRAGPVLLIGDQPVHPLVGEIPRHEPRHLLCVDRQHSHEPPRTWAWGWSAGGR